MSFFTLLVLTIGVFLVPSVALAQQSEAQPYHVEAGPYQLDVIANPSNLSVGTVQYLVRVYDSQTGQPVDDARVLVRSRHVDGEGEGWANALNTPASPADYTARVELEGPGLWAMSVEVFSDLGRVEVDIPPQTVPVPRQSRAGSLVFIGVFVVLIAGGVYLAWTIRRAQQKREAAGAG